jgi:hypothetical protein
MGLMVGQPRGRRQPLFAGGGLVLEYGVEIVNHPLAFGRENVLNLGELSPPVGQAVAAQDRPFILKRIGRERI